VPVATSPRTRHGPALPGDVLNQLRGALLDNPDPTKRQAGILVWQMIASKLFSSRQADSDFEAISYAVMDGHDYFDKSCNLNVQSVEVVFDATDPMLRIANHFRGTPAIAAPPGANCRVTDRVARAPEHFSPAGSCGHAACVRR
jgi:hypothetical protein